MLSGGLDSSAVASAARRIGPGGPLSTFSFRFDDVPASDERRFQDLVTSAGGYTPHVVRGDSLDPFTDFDRILYFSDEPTGAGNLFLNWVAWLQAGAAGVRVVLDGFFGDSAVSYGDDRHAELLRAARLVTWMREILAQRKVEGGGRRMVKHLIAMSVRAQLPQWAVSGTRQGQSPPVHVFVPLAPAASGRLSARAAHRDDVGFHTVRERQVEDIAHEAYTPLFEVKNKASAGVGVEVGFPFADRRLVELCVALPSSVKHRDGWDRWILRAGLEGRVPEPVRWRTGKADLLPNLARALRTTGRARLAAELEDSDGPLARFVDSAALNDQLRRLDAGDSHPVAALWTAACASAWLRTQTAAPPAVPSTLNSPPGPRLEA
jgi:asparagine synthase (glutamine-hydrolysing)